MIDLLDVGGGGGGEEEERDRNNRGRPVLRIPRPLNPEDLPEEFTDPEENRQGQDIRCKNIFD